jgi:hypothetical protein
MATIKFNDEIISDENNNIYDLNLFINENFNYIKENPDYYEKINITKFDFTSNIANTNNYKKLYKNYFYLNKLNNYNINLISTIFNTNSIKINRNDDNIITDISTHYKTNYINNFDRIIFDIENKSIETKLINQYLYYMNVFFNSKILNLEKNYKLLKDKNKILETNLNIFMNTKNYNYDKQETEIKYLKYKTNNYGELLNEYQEEIKKLNKKLNYLTITIISLFAFIFINYHS